MKASPRPRSAGSASTFDHPEIIRVDLESGLVCKLQPLYEDDGSLRWRSRLSEELDRRPRGGSGEARDEDEDSAATLMQIGVREQAEASEALTTSATTPSRRCARFVDSGQATSSDDVGDDLMLDLVGPIWGHGEVPPAASPTVALDERLR